MKIRSFTFFLIFFFPILFFSQNSQVGIGTTNPRGVLEVVSSNQGILIPRLTNVERNLMYPIPEGLTIYNTDANCVQYWDGVAWSCLDGSQKEVGILSKNYGGYRTDRSGDIVWANENDGYVMVSTSYSNDGDVSGNHGMSDIWMVKVNNQLDIVWKKNIGTETQERANTIVKNSNGYYIGGTQADTGNVGDFYILKTDNFGNIMWNKTYGGGQNDTLYRIISTVDGGCLAVGETSSYSNTGNVSGFHGGFSDGWIIKLDSSGNLQWQKTIGGSGYEKINDIVATNDGNFILIGSTSSTDGDFSGFTGESSFVVKVNSSGTILQKQSKSNTLHRIKKTTDGNYILSGNITVPGQSTNLSILKLDNNLNFLWEKNYGSTANDALFTSDIIQVPSGDYYALTEVAEGNGDVGSIVYGRDDLWITHLDSTGNIINKRVLGGNDADIEGTLLAVENNNILISASTYSEHGDMPGNYGNFDKWNIKLNSSLQTLTKYSNTGTISNTKSIGINTTKPEALLDMVSINRGVLIPSFTDADLPNISSPKLGMIIYNSSQRCIQAWNGTSWINQKIAQ